MSHSDVTPSPSEEMLAGLLAELEQVPPARRAAIVDRYLRENPAHASAIRELVDADAGVRPPAAADANSKRLRPGQKLGPFRVVRFVAQGGMGEVYEAVQDVLNRRVALKVIRNGIVSPTARARFLREEQVLAKLHQTNIVPVHHAGEEGDLQYCAMQFVDGASLHKIVTEVFRLETSEHGSRQTPPIREVVDSLLRSIPDPPAASMNAETVEHRESKASSQVAQASTRLTLSPKYFASVAGVMIQVAEAIQHCHDHNICHRDIKPSNLMIDSDENCWVIDYGLAGFANATSSPLASGDPSGAESAPWSGTESMTRLTPDNLSRSLELDTRLTQGPLGTPQYMAPEQFKGQSDPRSDVWSLGVTLYELLSLRPAFHGTGRGETQKLVETTEPPDVRKSVGNVPADLAAISRKAMAKNPAERYPSAQEFADDLRRWTQWEPTKVRPDWRTLRPLRLWAWRKKAYAMSVAVVFFALIGGLVFAAKLADIKEKQLVELKKEQDRQKAVLESQKITDGAHSVGWSHEAMRLLENANAFRAGDDLRDLAATTFIGLDAIPIYEHNLPFEQKEVHQGVGRVAFSPDGVRILAEGSDRSPSLLWDGQIASKPTASTRAGRGPVAVPDADSPLQLILPAGPRQPITLWNVGTNQKVLDIATPWPEKVREAALSPDARYAAVCFASRKIVVTLPPVTVLWAIDHKAQTVKKVAEWVGSFDAMAFTPDGKLLATGSDSGAVAVHSTADGKQLFRIQEGALPVTGLGFGRNFMRPSGERPAPAGPADNWLLAVGSKGGGLAVWELGSAPSRLNRYRGSEHAVYGVAFSPDGTALASCGRNVPFVWDVATGKRLLQFRTEGRIPAWTEGVAFSPDGRKIAFGSRVVFNEGGLNVYRLDEDRGCRSFRGFTSVVEKVWLSPSGKWVAALAQDWQLGVWDRATGQLQFLWSVPPGGTADNSAVAFDENDTAIVFSSGKRISKWSLDTGGRTDVWEVPPGLNDCLATEAGKNPLSIRREAGAKGLVLRARELKPKGELSQLYQIGRDELNGNDVGLMLSADGRMLLVNVFRDAANVRIHLKEGRSGKPIPIEPSTFPANSAAGGLSPSGNVMSVAGPNEYQFFKLPDLKRLGTHSDILDRVDDTAKLGVTVGKRGFDDPLGLELHRVGEERPLLTFDKGTTVISNSHGISPDGRFVYWGRPDGTVCVADVNKCLEQLVKFKDR